MALSEQQLADPATEPNPQIRVLVDLMQDTFRLSMDTKDLSVATEYSNAHELLLRACGYLYAAKNRLAGDV